MQRYRRIFRIEYFDQCFILNRLIFDKIKFLILILWGLFGIKCDAISPPTERPANMFPYRFQAQMRIPHQSYFFDLDHNGDDEIINLGNINFENNTPARIQILDKESALIEQINFNGRLQLPFVINWDQVGEDEIVVSYVRNDSLFIRILSWRGKLLTDECILTAEAFPDRKKNYHWTSGIQYLRWYDLDADGQKEFIFFMAEGYACAPRGIFVYDGRTLQLKWKYEIGPLIQEIPIIIDSDNDGYPEIIFGSSAPNNGYAQNGTDDQHAYLFSLNHLGQLRWRKTVGETYSTILTRCIDLDGDQKEDVVTFFFSSKQELPSTLEIINPLNGSVVRSLSLPIQQPSWAIMNQDDDVQQEICIFNVEGKMLLFDHQLDIIFSRNLPIINGSLYTCKDLDLDGHDEFFISSPLGTFCLNTDFDFKAKYSKALVLRPEIQVFHERKMKPRIAFHEEMQYELVTLEKNSFYLILYYGRILGVVLFLSIFVTLIYFIRRWHYQAHFHKIVLEKLAATCQFPFLIVNHQSKIMAANTPGLELLNLEKRKLPYQLSVTPASTELLQFLKTLPEREAIHQAKKIKLSDEHTQQFSIIAEPIQITGQKKTQWLVLVKEPEQGFNFSQAQTWVAMAQRIAHDLKNPLTSILLTLQRLQMEYRDQAPEQTNAYDYYTEKIIERIEKLRRTSRQFMKFINIEKLNLQPTHLNQLIEDYLTKSIVIPGDMLVVKKLAPELPLVHLDQEQMQMVLENLITNAFNAMPDGGTLTIGTSMVLDLQLTETNATTSDYLLLEIMDTGIGIPDEIKSRLFQPYVTDSAMGTGLGLAIVKKVIDDHQGMIEFNSEQNVGTSFSIYLPLQK